MELLPALTELRPPKEELEELRPPNEEREGALVERVTVLVERRGAGVLTVPRLLGTEVLRCTWMLFMLRPLTMRLLRGAGVLPPG